MQNVAKQASTANSTECQPSCQRTSAIAATRISGSVEASSVRCQMILPTGAANVRTSACRQHVLDRGGQALEQILSLQGRRHLGTGWGLLMEQRTQTIVEI